MDTTTREFSPTGSYIIDVPIGVEEDIDERVVSLWIAGSRTLLQLSSYKRDDGPQAPANRRLEARLRNEELADIRSERSEILDCPDVAAASGRDDEGVRWLYTYAVWPDLTILATLSGPDADSESFADQWAHAAVRSVRR